MKRSLLFITYCFFCAVAFAQPLTSLSKAEAEKTLAMLKEQKYVFFYCDCCGLAQADLIKMESAKIEKASDGSNAFSVRILGTKVMKFDSDASGNFSKPQVLNETFSDLASINTMMLPKDSRGLPLGYFLGKTAEETKSCMAFIYYPDAEDTELFNGFSNSPVYQNYALWFKSTIVPQLGNTDFIGNWDVIDICADATNCKGLPPGINSIKGSFDANGKVGLAVSGTNSKGSWKLERGKIISKDNDKTTIYGFRVENNVLTLRNMDKTNAAKDEKSLNFLKLTKI